MEGNRPRPEPWDYQVRAIDDIWGQFHDNVPSTLCVMATGTGKTFVGGWIVRDAIERYGARCLWLAHRDLLIRQAVSDLGFVGIDAAVECGLEHARESPMFESGPGCVVGSVQTLRGARLESWPKDSFDFVVIDEAHHAPSPSYRAILAYFKPTLLLGLTATPMRLDKRDLGTVFASVAHEYLLPHAIDDGNLKRIQIRRIMTDIDLSALSTKGKSDFSTEELDRLMLPHIGDLALLSRQYIDDRRTIAFLPGVPSAERFARAMSSLGIPTASVSGSTPPALRDVVYGDFRESRIRCLANCQIMTEGADFPFASAVMLGRKTKSMGLLSQMIGRGTRKYPGHDTMLLVDIAMLTGEHKLAEPARLLAKPGTPVEVVKRAQALIDDGEAEDLRRAIKQAGKEYLIRERERERDMTVREREVRHDALIYDAFGSDDMVNEPASRMQTERLPATEKQMATLEKFGLSFRGPLGRKQASAILEKCFRRRAEGLSSERQIRLLCRLGVPPAEARAMSFAAASSRIDALKRCVR